jgi:hypothetical protein
VLLTPVDTRLSVRLSRDLWSIEPLGKVARKVEAVTLADVNGLLEAGPFSKSFIYSLVLA